VQSLRRIELNEYNDLSQIPRASKHSSEKRDGFAVF
jgi:hypothetical protein